MNERDTLNIPELPMQVGDSSQYVSGIIALNQPIELVEIAVKGVRGDQEWQSGPVPVLGPFEEFVQALNSWRASLVYPSQPKVRTRTLEVSDLEPYCLRYRQAYELVGDGEALRAFRTQLWQEWKKSQVATGSFPSERGQRRFRRAIRKNFADALDAYLSEWKANKAKRPYGE